MAKSYDLRREVVVAKFQTLIDAVNALDGNTDEIEAKLESIITLLNSLDGKDYATETTLATLESTANAIESITDSIDNKTTANVIDSNNSTSTPLGIGGIFTGIGTDVGSFNSVTIQLFADVDSATDGMCFQFSTDGTNWDDSNDYNLDVSLSNARRFQFPVTAQYFRVKYENGNVSQTQFRVQTILHNSDVLTSIHRLDTGLTNDRSVTVTKSVIAGETSAGGGAFVNVKVSPSGSLEVNSNQDTHDNLNANANLQVGDVDVSVSNPVPVNISSINLPSGASTEAKQDDQITVLNSILSSLGGTVEGEESEKDLLRQLIIIMKFQTEEQIRTNNLLKIILS